MKLPKIDLSEFERPEPAKPAWLDNWCTLSGRMAMWSSHGGAWIVMLLDGTSRTQQIISVKPGQSLDEFMRVAKNIGA